MPQEEVRFSARELAVLEQAAQHLGLSAEQAAEFLAKKGLAKRANRPVRMTPAQVIPFGRRKP